MQYIIQEHVFSWTDRFHIMDANGQDCYYVEGEFLSFGRKLHIFLPDEREVARIEQELFHFRPHYNIYVEDTCVGTVVREFSLFKPYYVVEGLGWEVEGDFFAHTYRVTHQGETVVSMDKEWFTWGDCYCLHIADDVNPLVALATIIAIDCIIEQQ